MPVTIAVVVAIFVLILWVGVIVRFVGAIFSVRIRQQVAAHPAVHTVWLLAALLTFVGALLPALRSTTHHPPLSRTQWMLSGLSIACKVYQTEYGSFPSGDNAAITKALRGANPRNIVFSELKSPDFNSKGEVIDPWGTPYRFNLQNGQPPSIQSAGPDRVFGDKDDLTTWSP